MRGRLAARAEQSSRQDCDRVDLDGGRPSAMTPAKQRQAARMYADKTPVSEIAVVLGV